MTPRPASPAVRRKEMRLGLLLVEYGECAVFEQSWDDEPLGPFSSWDAAKEWIDRRHAKETRIAKKAKAS
jgi:hypothetical protein